MFTDILIQLALGIAAKEGWVTPSYEELGSFDADTLVQWLIKHNPDKEHIIREKYNYFKEITL